MRQFAKVFEMKIPGGSLALRTKGHCLVLPLLKQNNTVLRTMSLDLITIIIRDSMIFSLPAVSYDFVFLPEMLMLFSWQDEDTGRLPWEEMLNTIFFVL